MSLEIYSRLNICARCNDRYHGPFHECKPKYARLKDGRIVIIAEDWPGISKLDVYPLGESRPNDDCLERISVDYVIFSSTNLALIKGED